jgi:DNA-binding PadR family transcriptional regulator
MERKLLLLGMLRKHPMYGYQINEMIDTHLGTSVALTKPSAYRFLSQMAEQGWIEFDEEKEGNRPTRRVYSILPDGEGAFQAILRDRLADFSPNASHGTISIAFINEIPAKEALRLLKTRKTRIEETLNTLTLDEDHQGGFGHIIQHQILHLEAELVWLSGITHQLS